MSEKLQQPPRQCVEDHESDTGNVIFPVADVWTADTDASEEDTRLHDAAARDDVAEMEKLLAEGVDINAKRGSYDNTALHVATAEKKKKAINFLLSHGADRTITNRLGLTAAEYGHNQNVAAPVIPKATVDAPAGAISAPGSYRPVPNAVSLLHEVFLQFGQWFEKDSLEFSSFIMFAVSGVILSTFSCATGVFGLGAAACLSLASVGCGYGVPRLLAEPWYRHQKKHRHEEDLMTGIRTNNMSYVQTLLQAGANPNGCGRGYPLLEAAENFTSHDAEARQDVEEIMALLLDYKADPNVVDNKGYTALHHLAYRCDRLKTITTVLAHGANVDVVSKNGKTPLSLAVYSREESHVKLLLDHGANPNLVAPGKPTPLQIAMDRKPLSVVQDLIDHGADPNVYRKCGQPLLFNSDPACVQTLLQAPGANPNVQDNEGRTPLHRALMAGDRELADILLADPRTDRDILDKEGQPASAYLPLVYGAEEPPVPKLVLDSQPEKQMLPDWLAQSPRQVAAAPVEQGVPKLTEKPEPRIRFR